MGKPRGKTGETSSRRPGNQIRGSSAEVLDQLSKNLKRILRKTLPATLESAGDLLNLKSVAARAVHPDDALSRLDALNALLPRLIDQVSDENYAAAAKVMFGLSAGTRRQLLGERRLKAADKVGYSAEHFRAEVEPELIRTVAELIHKDLRRYHSRIKRSIASLEPTGDTPKLSEDDLTHEEELISRIWQYVYELRAETIAYFRLIRESGYAEQAEDHRQSVLRTQDDLRRLLKEYVETYGPLVPHGEAEYAAEALERLAAWRL